MALKTKANSLLQYRIAIRRYNIQNYSEFELEYLQSNSCSKSLDSRALFKLVSPHWPSDNS